MLELIEICKAYQKPVLTNVSFSIENRGLYLIRGESGVGKTTLLRLIAGLEKADSGEILWKEKAKISVVFQEPRLMPHLSLLENLFLVRKDRDEERAKAILKRLSLDGNESKRPHQLSGGMKLRAAIARSLYYGGDIYLWDEPTKELDPRNRETVAEIIAELAREKAVLVVTHDPLLQGGTEISLLSE